MHDLYKSVKYPTQSTERFFCLIFHFDKVPPSVYHRTCSSTIFFHQIHYKIVFHGNPNPCTAVCYCMVRYDIQSMS